VLVAHGALDDLVPVAHSRHTAELVPGATFREYAGHGHLTILSELPGIASALARRGS
jgi:pimeloyl-ACP methyl ester carboxylesterase